MQCVGEIETLVERIERTQDGIAIIERDVLDARQCPQYAGNVHLGNA